jgi:hypothetical protein
MCAESRTTKIIQTHNITYSIVLFIINFILFTLIFTHATVTKNQNNNKKMSFMASSVNHCGLETMSLIMTSFVRVDKDTCRLWFFCPKCFYLFTFGFLFYIWILNATVVVVPTRAQGRAIITSIGKLAALCTYVYKDERTYVCERYCSFCVEKEKNSSTIYFFFMYYY